MSPTLQQFLQVADMRRQVAQRESRQQRCQLADNDGQLAEWIRQTAAVKNWDDFIVGD